MAQNEGVLMQGPGRVREKRGRAPGSAKRLGRPSQEESRDRQDAVILAARSEFLRRGYRAATMKDIAAAAGVSKRSLYLWHRDKAALFQNCVFKGAVDLNLPKLDPLLDPQ